MEKDNDVKSVRIKRNKGDPPVESKFRVNLLAKLILGLHRFNST